MRNFNFMIVRTDEEARCMDVLYEADGYEPVLVGVRAPVQGENRDDVIRQATPIGIWDAIDIEKLPVVMPEVGETGRIEAPGPIVFEVGAPMAEVIQARGVEL